MSGKKNISVAIDGPAGAGKSTIAKLVARAFGLEYADTGAMYRGVALTALRASVAADDVAALSRIASETDFSFEAAERGGSLVNRVFIGGEEVTDAIREPEISSMASAVSALSGVRAALVAKQKRMGAAGGVAMEGRDIGGVVLPDAEVKIFLTASPEARARRRHLELLAADKSADYDTVLAEISARDLRDTTRADSPLKQADDAILVDTDGLSIEQVVARICDIVTEKTGRRPLTA
jgi:cytidylate kinase